jgi:hypothetical protein
MPRDSDFETEGIAPAGQKNHAGLGIRASDGGQGTGGRAT